MTLRLIAATALLLYGSPSGWGEARHARDAVQPADLPGDPH